MSKQKKVLGMDSMGVQKSMRTFDYFGDGLGQLPLNIMSGLVGQLTYFYTEKVGMAAGAVATMLLLAKILDAFSDLVMGKIMDRGKSPKGKCRPWFMRMLIPAFVIIIMMFTVPKASSGVQLAYVLITNILISAVIYTAIAIPYGALMAIRTESSEERAKMGVFRAAFGYIAGMIIAIAIIPITNMLGGDQAAWIKVAVVFAIVRALSLLLLYKTTRETKGVKVEGAELIENDTDADLPLKEGVKLLFQNKYWVIMLIVNVFVCVSYGLSGSGGTYYAKYVLGNDNLVGIMGAVGLIPTFIGFAAAGPMAKKFGMAKTCMISCGIGIAANVVRVFMPYSFAACLICGCFGTFANIPLMCLTTPLVNNCVEYNEWKFGKRMVGMSNSASSFGGKVGGALGGSLIGWMLAIGGYSAALKTQPQSAIYAILGFSIYVPLVLFIVMFLMYRKYDLEKIYPQIVAEIQERRKAAQNK